MRTILSLAAAALLAGALPSAGVAQTPAPNVAETFKPESGQAGKDVVWVPTQDDLVQRMLDIARVTKDDYLIDLGSGDGRTVIAAAKRGARAHGIEYNPDMVALAQRNAAREGVAERATFVRGDIFESDFSKASVITLFLLPDLNLRLRPILLQMAPGTRVVSNTFTMGDWTPDQTVEIPGTCTSFCRAYGWTIPAQVAGTWRLGNGELTLSQTFQRLEGTFREEGRSTPISDARMSGAEIAFTVAGQPYSGRVSGTAMEGRTADGKTWTATKVGG